jgi:MFS family permease
VNNRLVIALLAAGQFVMVLDGTVMNVSISQLVEDLDTTIPNIQLAITAYTLVMAALMLTGGKVGDILGSRRTFVVGLAVYGAGSFLTAASPNLAVLLIGWSLIEGLGAVLVIPAIASLTAANYQGSERALAYGILGGVAAAGVAIGPMIGGWVTSNFSWRWVFAAETVIVAVIIVGARRVPDAQNARERARLDVIGAVLSAVGFGLVVLGILRSATWGWVEPRRPPSIGDTELTPFGFSPTFACVIAGAFVLATFGRWERHREAAGSSVLVHLDVLRGVRLRAGLAAAAMQQFVLAGTFFVLPLYLQVVLGFDAFRSGKTILPLSLAMFFAALGGPVLLGGWAPRRIARVGLAGMALGEVVLLASMDFELRRVMFSVALILLGIGMGLLASQLGNVIMSTASPETTSETGGLQGTAVNLGASLGTALIGALLLSGLAGAFAGNVRASRLPEAVKTEVVAVAQAGIDFVPSAAVADVATDAGLPRAEVAELVGNYSNAQLRALRAALAAVALFVLGAFLVTGRLPDRPLSQDGGAE